MPAGSLGEVGREELAELVDLFYGVGSWHQLTGNVGRLGQARQAVFDGLLDLLDLVLVAEEQLVELLLATANVSDLFANRGQQAKDLVVVAHGVSRLAGPIKWRGGSRDRASTGRSSVHPLVGSRS